jgi:hypothetical protein
MELSFLFDSNIGMLGVHKPNKINEIDVLSFAMDSFIEDLIEDISRYHKFVHFVKDRVVRLINAPQRQIWGACDGGVRA